MKKIEKNIVVRDIFDMVKFSDEECEIKVRKILSRIRLCDIGNDKSYKIKEINDIVSDAIEITIKNPIISSADECDKLCLSLNGIMDRMIDVMKKYHKSHRKD